MKVFKTAEEMRTWSAKEKGRGRRIAFIPTMGALHEGHLSLLRKGRSLCNSVVLSIYVNPTQFGPAEDLAKYPRDTEGDLEKARECSTDAVFMPSDKIMYPQGHQTFIDVLDVTKYLCGASRPGHFRGVATVVAKLFNIVQPNIAIFGEKDFQQLVVIKQMVRDLNMPIEIVGSKIVREADGLAMSSRNRHLSPKEREAALLLNQSLDAAEKLISGGEKNTTRIIANVRKIIEPSALTRIDYAKIVDSETLADVPVIEKPALLALAVFVGATRLIDNRLFGRR